MVPFGSDDKQPGEILEEALLSFPIPKLQYDPVLGDY